MVFITRVSVAEFLVHLLRKACEELPWNKNDKELGDYNRKQIKGLWRALKSKSDFCQAFLHNPDDVCHDADVVVATPIIGAGFSIDIHFRSFHEIGRASCRERV